MKTTIKLFGLIAIGMIAAIALTFLACEPGTDPAPGLSGDILIKNGNSTITAPVQLGVQLTAVYGGEIETYTLQWNRYDVDIPSATGETYTPTKGGKYTVTVKADGYQNLTSPEVTVVAPCDGTSATATVAGMKVGWNLGNTLDATDEEGNRWMNNATVNAMETGWGNPVTTLENINTLKNAGFNTIRIPVSWVKASSGAPNYTIRTDWMNRVKEIVDYAVTNEMYIILNTHHDEDTFKFTLVNSTKSLDAFEKIWKQIAEAFKGYDEKLIFEGLNEPRTKGSAAEWNGGTAEERTILNLHYELFVDTVRASGGNNEKRILMINPYGASSETAAMNGLILPKDVMEGKIIVSYHAYAPYNFALNTGTGATANWSASNSSDTSAITMPIARAKSTFINKGIPVVIGEFGAMNRNNATTRAAWAKYYVSQAKAEGIPCVWWDNGVTTGTGELFGLLDRTTNQFTYPAIVDGLMDGVK